MKKIVIVALFLVSSMTMVAQNQFDKIESMKGVSSMMMNQKMLSMSKKLKAVRVEKARNGMMG